MTAMAARLQVTDVAAAIEVAVVRPSPKLLSILTISGCPMSPQKTALGEDEQIACGTAVKETSNQKCGRKKPLVGGTYHGPTSQLTQPPT